VRRRPPPGKIGWVASYLNRVGAIQRPSRGRYLITPLGRQMLDTHPTGISERGLGAHARAGDEWWIGKSSATVQVVSEDAPSGGIVQPWTSKCPLPIERY